MPLADAQLERYRTDGFTTGVHYDNDYFRAVFLSDKLVDVAEQVLGPDVALFTSYVISKRPSDGLAVDWHHDAAFSLSNQWRPSPSGWWQMTRTR